MVRLQLDDVILHKRRITRIICSYTIIDKSERARENKLATAHENFPHLFPRRFLLTSPADTKSIQQRLRIFETSSRCLRVAGK
mmetsp:Transcript_21289/g.33437  ORF Transcript_21289/g.33437 Transcript_21289/m.33437 type:complete len:83 (+) Transcript_21289:143-391(+)